MQPHFRHGQDSSSIAFATPSSSQRHRHSRSAQQEAPKMRLSRNSSPALPLRPALPLSATVGHLAIPEHETRADRSSATWTTSSGDLGFWSDTDEVEERIQFVHEYNRLAKKHGVRVLVPEDYDDSPGRSPQHRRGWFSRTFKRQTSGTSQASSTRSERKLPHRRSVSDLTMHFVHRRKDGLKDEDLQSLVRLCGKSMLYLPSDYAPSSLVLPTCFRSTAQYLVQHGANTRGVFRIPGAVKVINALYEYYSADPATDDVTGTIRCPNLPIHIKAGVHDVASTFKKFLAGLPGGILGSLSIFDALVAIHSQLYGDPELNRTKQSKLRARLIALAVGTLKSQYRRELICAVFGLLSLIGRAAETTPREDESGHPLPTSDLMGYNALSIVFGPLLVGDLIQGYTMKLADPSAGLVLLPLSPPRSKKDKQRRKTSEEHFVTLTAVDKILVANQVTEMVITHWREVVRHMKNLGVLKTQRQNPAPHQGTSWLRPSASESFAVKQVAPWESPAERSLNYDAQVSPKAPSPESAPGRVDSSTTQSTHAFSDKRDSFQIKRQRPRSSRSMSTNRLTTKPSLPILSPTAEESSISGSEPRNARQLMRHQLLFAPVQFSAAMEEPRYRSSRQGEGVSKTASIPRLQTAELTNTDQIIPEDGIQQGMDFEKAGQNDTRIPSSHTSRASNATSVMAKNKDDIDGRDRQRSHAKSRTLPTEQSVLRSEDISTESSSPIPSTAQHGFLQTRNSFGIDEETAALQTPQRWQDSTPASDIFASAKTFGKVVMPREDVNRSSRTELKLSQPDARISTSSSSRGMPDNQAKDSILTARSSRKKGSSSQKSINNQVRQSQSSVRRMPADGDTTIASETTTSTIRQGSRPSFLADKRTSWGSQDSLLRDNPDRYEAGINHVNELRPRPAISASQSQRLPVTGLTVENDMLEIATRRAGSELENNQSAVKPSSPPLGAEASPVVRRAKDSRSSKGTPSRVQTRPSKSTGNREEEMTTAEKIPRSVTRDFLQQGQPPAKITKITANGRRTSAASRSPPAEQAPETRSTGRGVKAMAALFENASKDLPSQVLPTPIQNAKPPPDMRSSTILAKYTVNNSPPKSARSAKSNSVKSEKAPPMRHSRSEEYVDFAEPQVVPLPRTTPRRHVDYSSASDTTSISLRSAIRARENERTPTRSEKFAHIPVRATMKMSPKSTSRVDRMSQHHVEDRQETHVPSLGRMTPHLEEPPVAYHINFSRPPSSSATKPDRGSDALAQESVAEMQRSGANASPAGTSILHAQIRNLQRQLDARSEETAQLRRQLETRANIDIGVLSEELRASKRECRMWRERAEAAEKRVAVFERFTAKVRSLRDKQYLESDGDDLTVEVYGEPKSDRSKDHGPGREAGGDGQRDSGESASASLHTEDEAVVSQRIRESLQTMRRSSPYNSRNGTDEFRVQHQLRGRDAGSAAYTSSTSDYAFAGRHRVRGDGYISDTAAKVWMAAQELLEHDDMNNWLNGSVP